MKLLSNPDQHFLREEKKKTRSTTTIIANYFEISIFCFFSIFFAFYLSFPYLLFESFNDFLLENFFRTNNIISFILEKFLSFFVLPITSLGAFNMLNILVDTSHRKWLKLFGVIDKYKETRDKVLLFLLSNKVSFNDKLIVDNENGNIYVKYNLKNGKVVTFSFIYKYLADSISYERSLLLINKLYGEKIFFIYKFFYLFGYLSPDKIICFFERLFNRGNERKTVKSILYDIYELNLKKNDEEKKDNSLNYQIVFLRDGILKRVLQSNNDVFFEDNNIFFSNFHNLNDIINELIDIENIRIKEQEKKENSVV